MATVLGINLNTTVENVENIVKELIINPDITVLELFEILEYLPKIDSNEFYSLILKQRKELESLYLNIRTEAKEAFLNRKKAKIDAFCSDKRTIVLKSEIEDLYKMAGIKAIESIIDKKVSVAKTPNQIKEYLDKFIVGQENAKKALATQLYIHLIKKDASNSNILPGVTTLFAGPSGVGKSYLIEKGCELLKIPFVKVDAASLVGSGYVGFCVNDIYLKLYHAANKDLEKMKHGIVFIDEVDKLALNEIDHIGTASIQQELLFFLENKNIEFSEDKKNSFENKISLKNHNIAVFFAGAFQELFSFKNINNKQIGFGKSNVQQNNKNHTITLEILIEHGRLMPEFVGRIKNIVQLEPLKKEEIKEVFLKKENTFSKFHYLFAMHNIELSITDDAMDTISEVILSKKLGLRYLEQMLNKVLTPLLYNINSANANLIITKNMILEAEKNGKI